MNRLECYFDNSATTMLLDEVMQELRESMQKDYGNPSSAHRKGLEAERKLKSAREVVAKSLGAKSKEIIFTSGGTEANNLALKGVSQLAKSRRKHLITSEIEHDSVYNTIRALEEQEGFSVTYLKPNRYGLISSEQVLSAITEDTFLISLMHVHNEIGTINDIVNLEKKLREQNKKRKNLIHLHIDAVQSYLKIDLNVNKMPAISSMSISSHKVHGPKGSGALYLKETSKISPLLHGGGQEYGYRCGTENTLGIWGFAKAVELQMNDIEQRMRAVSDLKNHFVQSLSDHIPHFSINSPKQSAAHICNISFHGIPAEVLLHALEEKGIYVSTGSACSSKKKSSRVLDKLQLSKEVKQSAIRFSFSALNTLEEVEYAIDVIKERVQALRKILKYH